MNTPTKGCLLRIFIGESDRANGKPLYELIVKQARALRLSGATVLKGAMGFGANSKLHTAKLLRLSEDLPIVIEIVDDREKIEQLLPFLDEVIIEGMVTLENVEVWCYRANHDKKEN
jgi:PII-like signaling protein